MPNRLANEKSPYLLQHTENPVDWYPWGEEAFSKAVREDKPVFLSVGYSTCHWCHVMAHESFENEEIAEILNRDFVSVKVDREERPDVDSLYMRVCQAMTGSGGWPLTVLLTPNKEPFFAGTYLPPESRGGMLGLKALLKHAKVAYDERRNELTESGREIIEALKAYEAPGEEPSAIKLLERAREQFYQTFDEAYGGFGSAPKFPSPQNLLFLMDFYRLKKDAVALKMAEKTLDAMQRGGIFDHIGGGFSRYATDRAWLIPHFEKMLYDNALLAYTYLSAYALTQKEDYREVAKRTLQYVLRELRSEEGGFYTAQDADSEGEEGRFYVFTPVEIKEVLGENGERFLRYFGMSERGNFEGKNILHRMGSVEKDPSLEALFEKVYDYRKKRAKLHTDDKILMSLNGLMIGALSMASRVLDDEAYLKEAKKTLAFLEDTLIEGDRIFTRFRDGERSREGFLDDYASFIWGLLELFETTGDRTLLFKAKRWAKTTEELFKDSENGGYYLSPSDEELPLRPKETYDGAMPSGNSLMAKNLVMLAKRTGEEDLREGARRQLSFMAREASDAPMGYGFFLTALIEGKPLMEEMVCENGVCRLREDRVKG